MSVSPLGWMTLGFIAFLLALVLLARDAPCYGCAEVSCFRNGPACEGNCSCQWVDELHGFCG